MAFSCEDMWHFISLGEQNLTEVLSWYFLINQVPFMIGFEPQVEKNKNVQTHVLIKYLTL